MEINNPVDSYIFENVVETLTTADIYSGASVSDSKERREERPPDERGLRVEPQQKQQQLQKQQQNRRRSLLWQCYI